MDMDQRRVPRQIAGWNVSYRLERRPSRGWHGCRMLDLSPAGAAIEVYDAPAAELRGASIVVDFEIGARVGSGVQLRGVVRDTGPGPYGGIRVGLEFSEAVPASIAPLVAQQSA